MLTSLDNTIHAKPYVTLRELLLKQRNKLNFSQRYLAKKLDVPHSFIYKIETGDRRLDAIECIKYCLNFVFYTIHTILLN